MPHAMSDVTRDAAAAGVCETGTSRPWPFRLRPLAGYVCVAAAGAVGLLAGRAIGVDAAAFEDKVLLVIRFMAALKLACVVLAAALLHWRLHQPIAPRLASAYAGALAAMAAGAGSIWSLAIVPGALLFHLGLLGFLIFAWRDGDVRLPRGRRLTAPVPPTGNRAAP